MSPKHLWAIEEGRSRLHHCPYYNKSLHVCLLTVNNWVVSWGVNAGYCPQSSTFKKIPNIHAEESALKRFKKQYSIKKIGKLTLYSFRFLRNGSLASAKPCYRCGLLLNRYKPRKIFYSNEKGEIIQWQK